jgi:hypothetical protein
MRLRSAKTCNKDAGHTVDEPPSQATITTRRRGRSREEKAVPASQRTQEVLKDVRKNSQTLAEEPLLKDAISAVDLTDPTQSKLLEKYGQADTDPEDASEQGPEPSKRAIIRTPGPSPRSGKVMDADRAKEEGVGCPSPHDVTPLAGNPPSLTDQKEHPANEERNIQSRFLDEAPCTARSLATTSTKQDNALRETAESFDLAAEAAQVAEALLQNGNEPTDADTPAIQQGTIPCTSRKEPDLKESRSTAAGRASKQMPNANVNADSEAAKGPHCQFHSAAVADNRRPSDHGRTGSHDVISLMAPCEPMASLSPRTAVDRGSDSMLDSHVKPQKYKGFSSRGDPQDGLKLAACPQVQTEPQEASAGVAKAVSDAAVSALEPLADGCSGHGSHVLQSRRSLRTASAEAYERGVNA